MSAIFEFFSTLGNAITAFFDFIGSMFADGIKVIDVFIELLPAMPAFLTWMPYGLVSSVSLIITVCVVFRVLGWGD